MKKKFEELQAVINGNGWKAQHEAFGTHFAKDASAEYLSTVGNRMRMHCAQSPLLMKGGAWFQ